MLILGCAFVVHSQTAFGDPRAESGELSSLIGASPTSGARGLGWMTPSPPRVVAAPGIHPELAHHRLHQPLELGFRCQRRSRGYSPSTALAVAGLHLRCNRRSQLPRHQLRPLHAHPAGQPRDDLVTTAG